MSRVFVTSVFVTCVDRVCLRSACDLKCKKWVSSNERACLQMSVSSNERVFNFVVDEVEGSYIPLGADTVRSCYY